MPVRMSWLDVKLGFRLLVRYPGLTVVGGLAMAFAIGVGAGTFELVKQMAYPTLPLEDGDRIVGIRNRDVVENRAEDRALHDFATWRDELRSVVDLGAFRTVDRNLILPDGPAAPVEVAEVGASAFRVARVAPLLGRTLVEEDERAGAPPVVVIGYDVWQARFAGDPRVLGRDVRLGDRVHTVVGVMPEGFGFPVAHGLWVPFRLNALDHERGQGPAIRVFGRLAPGVALEAAQAELTAIGARVAADHPDTHEHLRPQVLPYTRSISGRSGAESAALLSVNLFLVMLVVLVCANVALLTFARAATREREILVRSALGATRGRITGQLFAEALVLGCVAAFVGLVAASFVVKGWLGVMQAEAGEPIPFWYHRGLAPTTVLYAAALTVLGAVIAGVLPALKLTGRRVQLHLQRVSAGGSGIRFGGVWTAVVIAQVAVTVAFPATAFVVRRSVVAIRSMDVGFPAERYLSARLERDRDVAAGAGAEAEGAASPAGFAATVRELERRLEADPAVLGVTFADPLPRTFHPQRRIEAEGAAATPQAGPGHRVGRASVALDYFEVLGAPVLSGRAFHPGDLAAEQGGVIVNQSFVDRVLGGRSAIGRRVRYAVPPDEEPGPWYEIVGVVKDLGMVNGNVAADAGIYHPALPGAGSPVRAVIHVRGATESFVPRLRSVAAEVDPTLRLHDVLPLDEVGANLWREFDFLFRTLAAVSSIALLLALAGIYAVMSFAVSRRTREIGIRVALGAGARQVVTAIFRRSLTHVALGVLAGGAATTLLVHASSTGGLTARGAALVAAYATLMLGVCLLACVVPTRRALGIEPRDALKAEG